MLKILFSLLIFAPAALAQEFDLRSLPKGFSFSSNEEDALVTVRYLRPDGDEYIFEEEIAYFDGRVEIALLRVNNASQATFWSLNGEQTFYSPHDCGPSLGECFYSFTDKDGAVKVKTVSRMIGDVRFSDEFTLVEGEWLFWNRDCTIYDEYGFWVDYVRTYWDGETTQGYRVQDTPNRIDELWRMCDPAAAVS